MCLSTVYKETGGERQMICEYVSGIKIEKNSLSFTDIMGQETNVTGVLKNLDFIKNEILIEEVKEA